MENDQSRDELATIREAIGGLELDVVFRASGHKSSEGDGRTAADIRRELLEDPDGAQ